MEEKNKKKVSSRATKIESRKKEQPKKAKGNKEEEELKIKKPVNEDRRKLKCCCLGCLIIIIVSLFLISYSVSASGLVNVPLLSPIFFGDGPEPTREVEPESNAENVIEQRIAKSIIGGSNRLALTEEELTGLITEENVLEEGNIMIEDNQLEIFG